MQDDAILCADFLTTLDLALTARPDSLVALFVPTALRHGSRRLLEACIRDEPFCQLDPYETWVPVVALAWPARLIVPFCEWARPRFPPERKRYADDAIVGTFVKERGERVWATVPSLVDHPDDEPTILHKKLPQIARRATCFAGERAAMIDWSKA